MNGNYSVAVIFLIVLVMWAIFLKQNKYEGMTAEEWFTEFEDAEIKHQNFRVCVEEYEGFDSATKNEYGGVFNYCD